MRVSHFVEYIGVSIRRISDEHVCLGDLVVNPSEDTFLEYLLIDPLSVSASVFTCRTNAELIRVIKIRIKRH